MSIRAHMPKFFLGSWVGWLILCAITFSNAGVNLLLFFGVLAIAIVWGLVWLTRVTRYILHRKKSSNPLAHPFIYFIIEPFVAIAVLALAVFGAFSDVRFAISEPFLTRYAEDIRAGKIKQSLDLNSPSHWVGLYRVSRTDLLKDGTVRFLTSRYGFADMAGFAYSTSNPPPVQGEDFYKPLYGQWWHWHESW